jgi:DNA-binding Lrp family transcriptional regulator
MLMKDLELMIVSELMKNSRRSDRELAKAVGVSQPTVSRTIARLEKEGVLKEYTVIPDYQKLGFSLAVFTFGCVKEEYMRPEKIEEARRTFREKFMDASLEVVLNERGIGLGYDGIAVSFHRSYGEYADFKRRMLQMPFVNPSKVESFIIDLNDSVHYRYLTFSYLAQHILKALPIRARTNRRGRRPHSQTEKGQAGATDSWESEGKRS